MSNNFNSFVSTFATDFVSVSFKNSVSSLNIAPVAGSIINKPNGPPNIIFPKYHPFSLNSTGTTFLSYPTFSNVTWYLALEKNPAPDFNFNVAGVLPV
jgi:hypothetical protein